MTVAAAQPFRRTQARPMRTGRRPRGTVMILVVALLGILFVAGAAFLQSVTFQARTVRADKEERAVTAGLEAVHALSRELLTRRWLDGDGMPYVPPPDNPATDTVDESRAVVIPGPSSLWPYYLQAPAYGVSLGLDPLLASTEPFENTDEGLYTVPTDLNRALLGFEQPQVRQPDIGQPPRVADWATRIDRARAQWAGAANYPEFDPEPRLRLADADGDGVADSVVVVIGNPAPMTLLERQVGEVLEQWFPATLRETLAEQLRASDVPPGDNRLYLSLRVIDHGSMVNATCTHPYLVNEIINDWNDPPLAAKFNHSGGVNLPGGLHFTPTAYRPEIEERALRYRNILPARSLARTALQAELRGWRYPDPLVTEPLLYAWSDKGGIGGSLAAHRWWPFDPGLETGSGLPYRVLFDASQTVGDPLTNEWAYDRRHLLTTVSYDDLLVRSVRFLDHADLGNARNRDIVEWMRADSHRFRWSYPYELYNRDPGDPRLGRLQLSIPHLEEFLSTRGGVDNLPTLRTSSPDDWLYVVGNIYDTFWLMLWNHPDLDGSGTYEPWDSTNLKETDDWHRARLAASLTANFIDFADSDDEPTYIQLLDNGGQMIDTNGDSVADYGVFGVERQPYITEFVSVTWNEGTQEDPILHTAYAVELFNPYTVTLPVVGWKLRFSDETNPDEFEIDNPAAGIGAGEFAIYYVSPLANPPLNLDPGAPSPFRPPDDTTGLSFDLSAAGGRVELLRPVGSEWVAVDRFDVKEGGEASEFGPAMQAATVSLERDTTPGAWRTPVPRWEEQTSEHTLGIDNNFKDPTIRPVQVDFANTGSLTTAYPTTGTLLLLMRVAHEYDASGDAGEEKSDPFNHVPYLRSDGTGGSLAAKGLIHDYHQIDNGRMPVFDVGEPVASPGLAGSKPYYHKLPESRIGKAQGVEGLPWGQFVFDYFTTLPLYRQWERDDGFDQPAVDQGGLRVRGRINIGTAPWKVLAGLPLRPLDQLPAPFQPKLAGPYSRDSYDMSQVALQSSSMRIGHELAKAIVAYRDAREVPHDCNVGGGPDCSYDYRDRVTEDPSTQYLAGMRQGRGFLTVGELANIRRGADAISSGPHAVARFDYGSVGSVDGLGNPAEDYVTAVALLVGLGDWVTTRSHVFTIYGTLRGPDTGTLASIAEADAKAIRFEETVNRLPTFFNTRAPLDRIGERFVGKYEEARAD